MLFAVTVIDWAFAIRKGVQEMLQPTGILQTEESLL